MVHTNTAGELDQATILASWAGAALGQSGKQQARAVHAKAEPWLNTFGFEFSEFWNRGGTVQKNISGFIVRYIKEVTPLLQPLWFEESMIAFEHELPG